jgi:hypothetical protein
MGYKERLEQRKEEVKTQGQAGQVTGFHTSVNQGMQGLPTNMRS